MSSIVAKCTALIFLAFLAPWMSLGSGSEVRAATRYRTVTMTGHSMYPTLRNGEKLLIDLTAYRHGTPARQDIILFRAVQAGQPDTEFIKRIIGLPGETVSVHTDAVYINGHRLKEPYIDAAHRPLYSEWPTRIPKHEYFVLGDNRNNSQDSHLWGMLAKRYIVGRVVGIKEAGA
jgi:signal peptidase I